jgi:hypothetical protein
MEGEREYIHYSILVQKFFEKPRERWGGGGLTNNIDIREICREDDR